MSCDLALRAHYFADAPARAEFKRFLHSIHRLDLTRWEDAGYWDSSRYTAFSFFEDSKIVATVNVFSVRMIVRGELAQIAQFSGVGTDPAYRRRGLGRRLTEAALAWAADTHTGFVLFADEDALPFYRAGGFELVPENAAVITAPDSAPCAGLRRLDVASPTDRALLERLVHGRAPLSDVLASLEPSLALFHGLYPMRELAWYAPELDVALFAKTDGERLTLFDVIGPRVPSWAQLHPFLAGLPHRTVGFQFEPDRLGVTAHAREPQRNNAHVRAPFTLPADTVFPFTARA